MSGKHLLLVDDDPNLRESLKIGLELRDYAVTVAANGMEAIQESKR